MSDTPNPIDIDLLLTRLKSVSPWSEMDDGVKFDNRYYLINHLDVLTHGAHPYEHYLSHGKSAGRKWKVWSGEIDTETAGVASEESSSFRPLGDQSIVFNRQSFAQLAMQSRQILEIGPFTSPLLSGEGVSYADVLDTDALRQQADQMGLQKSGVPKIDFVVSANNLLTINRKFDTVFSSHVIEHQPDLVSHLKQVNELLNDGGRYFLLIPDHRYCFDHYQTQSTVIDVISAHQESRHRHAASTLLKHRSCMTHNDPVEHWNNNHGSFSGLNREMLKETQILWDDKDSYIDCHAWYFTPDSWVIIVNELKRLDLLSFEIEFLQSTQVNDIEFYSVLRKTKQPI